MIGEIHKNTPLSAYQPSQDVIDFTKAVKDDYNEGVRIINQTWVELNDRSIIDDENRGQSMFNAFVDTSVEDIHEAWKWRGTRSMARNKGIAMHAQLTANYLLPLFMAQNDEDELDRDMSEIMRDMIEWMAQPSNSNYQSSFLQVVFGMMTNPVTFLGAEYNEIMQTIKEKKQDGTFEVREIMDEVLSGFQANIWSSTQVLITNAYERNIQKQKSIIKRRYVDKKELEAKWGDHENWNFVTPGVKSIYSEEEGLFYDVYDDDHRYLVAEETYMNRREDVEVTFINGIYFGSSDIEVNPMKHRDNRGAPKYNVTPFGYSRIGNHFFYYKSMMNALQWDNMLYDAMSEVVMNRSLLEVEMPIAISGSDKVDSEVVFPGAVASFEDKDTKVTPLLPPSNLGAGYSALEATQQSIEEGSVNDTISGDLPEASQKAFNVAQAQANARKLIGGVGKSLAESVIQYGDLMKDIAINHITVPEVDQLVGGQMKLKYRQFVLPDKESGGRVANRAIKFDESLIGLELTDKEREERELKLLEKMGDNKDSIAWVNPELFAKLRYLTKVDVEEMFAKSNEYWQPILMTLKSQLAADPFVNQENLTRKLMYSFFQSDSEDLVNDQPTALPGAPQGEPGSMVAGQVENRAVQNAVQNIV